MLAMLVRRAQFRFASNNSVGELVDVSLLACRRRRLALNELKMQELVNFSLDFHLFSDTRNN